MSNPISRELIQRLTDALDELRNLISAIKDGSYEPDSFTLQPLETAIHDVSAALAQPEQQGPTDAADRIAHYLEQRRLIRGLDPEVINTLHAGTDEPRQAALTVSDLEALTRYACPTIQPVPGDQWHDDDGDVLWWRFPVEEPPYVGSPLCDDWPDYHTHFTRLDVPADPSTTP